MVFVIDSTGDRTAEAYDGVAGLAPRLHVEFDTGAQPTADFTYSVSDLTVTFTDASTDSDGAVVSWSWDFGDGNTSSAQSPSHTYASVGTYTVTLAATDNDGSTDSVSQSVTVTATNTAPTARFTFTTSDLTADFTDTSTDSDGTIVAWSWNFGDGNTSTAQDLSHTYTSGGTYNVSLAVTDDNGAQDTTSQSVTLTDLNAPPAAPSNLVATVQLTGKGKNKSKDVTLEWNDNADNETFFVIERCKETGKGKSKICSFSEYITLPANTTTLQDGPLSGTYKYRLKSRNDNGDSWYSNEVKI